LLNLPQTSPVNCVLVRNRDLSTETARYPQIFDSAHRQSVAIRVKPACRNVVDSPSISRKAITGADSHKDGWGPGDTFSSNQNDRRRAAGLSKIAQIDEIRIASGRGWTKAD
jgi:hypothetical protein